MSGHVDRESTMRDGWKQQIRIAPPPEHFTEEHRVFGTPAQRIASAAPPLGGSRRAVHTPALQQEQPSTIQRIPKPAEMVRTVGRAELSVGRRSNGSTFRAVDIDAGQMHDCGFVHANVSAGVTGGESAATNSRIGEVRKSWPRQYPHNLPYGQHPGDRICPRGQSQLWCECETCTYWRNRYAPGDG